MQRKLSPEEMAEYYRGVHRASQARDSSDELDAVIHPGAGEWINRFTDYAHRLGMEHAFRYLRRQFGTLEGREVLDIGCGRGRWVREYAARGAHVTGVDIAPDAIERLRTQFPGHEFRCLNLTTAALPDAHYDVVNSVTVVQHIPEREQAAVLRSLAQALKPGGFLVLLENVAGFDAPHVFPHKRDDWVAMAEAAGLKLCADWPSNFELLLEWSSRAAGALRSGGPAAAPGSNSASVPRPTFKSRLKSGLALLSFPIERFCHMIPWFPATHWVMVFRKPQ